MKSIFISAILCSSLYLTQTASAVNEFENNLSSQATVSKEQWMYVQKQLVGKIDEFTSLTNKLGTFLQNHSSLLSIPTGALSIAAAFSVGGRYSRSIDRFLPDNENFQFALIIGGIAALPLLNQYIMRKIGEFLANKKVSCQKSLALFVSDWHNHKPHTPQELHHLFDTLAAQGVTNIRPANAQSLVENVLGITVVMQSLT